MVGVLLWSFFYFEHFFEKNCELDCCVTLQEIKVSLNLNRLGIQIVHRVSSITCPKQNVSCKQMIKRREKLSITPRLHFWGAGWRFSGVRNFFFFFLLLAVHDTTPTLASPPSPLPHVPSNSKKFLSEI